MKELSERLLSILPAHEAGLSIEHNPHKTYYEAVEDYIDEHGYIQWGSEEQKLKCIETDSIWIVEWYPNSPVGSCTFAAPTFEDLLNMLRSD